MEVFVAGTDDALFHIWQTAPDSGWSGWDSLGGEPAQPPAIGQNADGRLELFAIGRAMPNEVWHRWQLTPGGAWSDVPQDWQQTSLGGPAHQLYVTSSDAVLARTDAGLFRSTDSGATWTQLGLPATPGVVEVDPYRRRADHLCRQHRRTPQEHQRRRQLGAGACPRPVRK